MSRITEIYAGMSPIQGLALLLPNDEGFKILTCTNTHTHGIGLHDGTHSTGAADMVPPDQLVSLREAARKDWARP